MLILPSARFLCTRVLWSTTIFRLCWFPRGLWYIAVVVEYQAQSVVMQTGLRASSEWYIHMYIFALCLKNPADGKKWNIILSCTATFPSSTIACSPGLPKFEKKNWRQKDNMPIQIMPPILGVDGILSRFITSILSIAEIIYTSLPPMTPSIVVEKVPWGVARAVPNIGKYFGKAVCRFGTTEVLSWVYFGGGYCDMRFSWHALQAWTDGC